MEINSSALSKEGTRWVAILTVMAILAGSISIVHGLVTVTIMVGVAYIIDNKEDEEKLLKVVSYVTVSGALIFVLANLFSEPLIGEMGLTIQLLGFVLIPAVDYYKKRRS